MFRVVLSSFVCIASAQLAAWPATSYSPYYQSIFGPLRTPVNAVPVIGQGVAPGAIPAPAPIAAPAYAYPAPAPIYRTSFAPAPLAVPYYASRPVVAEVFPRAVPAYIPFATRPIFIGSSKAK